jgi:hypothetical protein
MRPAGDQSLAVKDRSGVPAETVDEKQRCGQAERKPGADCRVLAPGGLAWITARPAAHGTVMMLW